MKAETRIYGPGINPAIVAAVTDPKLVPFSHSTIQGPGWAGVDYGTAGPGRQSVRLCADGEAVDLIVFEGWAVAYRVRFDAATPSAVIAAATHEVIRGLPLIWKES